MGHSSLDMDINDRIIFQVPCSIFPDLHGTVLGSELMSFPLFKMRIFALLASIQCSE